MTTYELLRWISCKVAHILRSGEVILSTVRSISNFTYLEWLQPYLSGMAPNFTLPCYLEWLNYHTLMFKMVLFDQQPQRKLSDWGMEAHRLQWFIFLNGGAIRPSDLLLMAFLSSQPHPYQSSSLTQFSQEWVCRKVVVKHSINPSNICQIN